LLNREAGVTTGADFQKKELRRYGFTRIQSADRRFDAALGEGFFPLVGHAATSHNSKFNIGFYPGLIPNLRNTQTVYEQ